MLRTLRQQAKSAREAVGIRLEHRTRVMTPCRRQRLELVLSAVEAGETKRPQRILDAGAGEGILAVELARRHRDWHIVAVDCNHAMLDRGRRRCHASAVSNVTFVNADLTGDLGTDQFDVVMAIECLEEIADDQAALRAMARALRPGGRLIAHVPDRDWAPVLPGSASTWRHEVRHGYTADELRTKMEQAGLVVDAVRPTARSAVFVAQEISDRIKDSSLRVRTLSLPVILAAEGLERRRMTWGACRALLIDAHRAGPNTGGRVNGGARTLSCEVADLASLGQAEKARWEAIRQATPGLESPYFTYEFCAIVASVRRDARVGVLDESNSIVGFFPFQRDPAGRGRPVGGKISDHHGVIAGPDLAWDARELLRSVRLRSYSFDHLTPPRGVFGSYVRALDASPFLDLSAGFSTYKEATRAAGLGGLKEAEMKLRRLERRVGRVRFAFHEPGASALQTLMGWKSRQYRRTTGFDPVSLRWVSEVIERVHAAQTPTFSGVLSCLYVDDRLIATHLGMRAGSTLHSWIPAYDTDFATYSPGLVLLLKLAQFAAADGIRTLDLGKGPESYKRRFTCDAIPVGVGSVECGLLAPAWSRVSDAAWTAVLSSRCYDRAHQLRRRLQFR